MNVTAAKYAVIVGLGRTGLSCARYLRARGWRLAVTDTRQKPPELAGLAALDPTIPLSVGGLDTRLLDGADCVVASPGVSLEEPFFVTARGLGIEIVGDIELFARAADAPVVGITGTNGKSTVTTLVGRMAERAGLRVRVGGNLGEPALDLLGPRAATSTSGAAPTQLYVLELSSFQLDATTSLDLKAATVLNVSPDHLDRYPTVAAYADSKARIFARCETAVINLDDPLVVAMPRPGQKTVSFSLRASIGADYAVATRDGEWWLTRRDEALLRVSAMKIKGLHNAANALASLALGDALGLSMHAMLEELATFTGLPHRSQWVADVHGVTYINDSKGTNVGATIAAVSGMQGPLVMIAGGDGKNQDFAVLADAFRGKVRHTVLIGRDAAAIAVALKGVCTLEMCSSLEDAVRAAAKAAQPGDTVLLSPACASLDMFRDYTHRGAVFTQAVKELAA
ncbi:MAG TPA: UDP-N-acetylmuramoyl-L-alanine--D-glutamate ligase [Steroidobacteraceae bacterium]|jgi:UDP-N-acetylmuramoylalanine--D-glutamate ligase|nr:UDP-N-acetylmuramoyl-L-alanine--D-glutamate ligase [Steroidobacteraceae bacterium]